jgi:hypothetical protein
MRFLTGLLAVVESGLFDLVTAGLVADRDDLRKLALASCFSNTSISTTGVGVTGP